MFDFKMLHEWANEQEPVFIVGPERSGTSMIFRSVVSHPSFCSFENATVETFCFVRPCALFNEKSPENYEMRLYLGGEYANFVKAISPLREINKLCDQLALPRNIFVKNRQVVWNRRNYRELLRVFFYFSWQNLGKNRLAEKTPAHIRAIDQIFDCFPKAKVLICVRDPVEIIASHRKRYAKEIELGKLADDESLSWLNKKAEHYMHYFEHVDQLISQAAATYADNVLSVPYKKVTQEPEFIRAIFDFLNERVAGSGNVLQGDGGKSLTWDPLLASAPVANEIELDKWLTDEDIDYLRSGGEAIRFKLHAWRL